MSEFTREVSFLPQYDYRNEPNDNRGCRGMQIRFVLRGPDGALTFNVNTGWLSRPRSARPEGPGMDDSLADSFPDNSGVHLHCPERRKDWWLGPGECDVLGGQCYGDGGYLVGDPVLDALVAEGDDGVWRELESIYRAWFADDEVTP